MGIRIVRRETRMVGRREEMASLSWGLLSKKVFWRTG